MPTSLPADLPTSYTDETLKQTIHAGAHNNANSFLNQLKVWLTENVGGGGSGGTFPLAAVRLATAAALPSCNYANGSAGVGATLTATANAALTVDGVAVATSDRILVKDQATQAHNGVYTVTATGSAGAPFVLTRATDADQNTELVYKSSVFVTAGTANANGTWQQNTNATITFGTTAIVWVLVGVQGGLSANSVNSSHIVDLSIATADIADGAITSAKLAGGAVGTTALANNGVTVGKMATMAANNLLGNATGSTAAPAAIPLDASLEFSGGNLRRAAITGNVTIAAGSNASVIPASTVTPAMLNSSNPGSASSTTYYRGDGFWGTPAGSGGGYTGFINAHDYGLVAGTGTDGTANVDAMRQAIAAANTLASNQGSQARVLVLAGHPNQVYMFTTGRGGGGGSQSIVESGTWNNGRWAYVIMSGVVIYAPFAEHRMISGYNLDGTSNTGTYTNNSYNRHGFVTTHAAGANSTPTTDCGVIGVRYNCNGQNMGAKVGVFKGVEFNRAERVICKDVHVFDGFGMNGSGTAQPGTTTTISNVGTNTGAGANGSITWTQTAAGPADGETITFVRAGGVRCHAVITSGGGSTTLTATYKGTPGASALAIGDECWDNPNYEAFQFEVNHGLGVFYENCLSYITGPYNAPTGGAANAGYSVNFGTFVTYNNCGGWNMRAHDNGAASNGTVFTSYQSSSIYHVGCWGHSTRKVFNVEHNFGLISYTDCHAGWRVASSVPTIGTYTALTGTTGDFGSPSSISFAWQCLHSGGAASGPGVGGGDLGDLPMIELHNCSSVGYEVAINSQVTTSFQLASAGNTGTTLIAASSVFTSDDIGRFVQAGTGPLVRISAFTSGTTVTTEQAHGGANNDPCHVIGTFIKVRGGWFGKGASFFKSGSGGSAKSGATTNNTGSNGVDVSVTTATANFFTAADVGRSLTIAGSIRGIIKTFVSGTSVTVDRTTTAHTSGQAITVSAGSWGDLGLAFDCSGETVYDMSVGWGDSCGPRNGNLLANHKYDLASLANQEPGLQQMYARHGQLTYNPYGTDAICYVSAVGAVTWNAGGIKVRGGKISPRQDLEDTMTVIPQAACPTQTTTPSGFIAASSTTNTNTTPIAVNTTFNALDIKPTVSLKVPAGGGVLFDCTAMTNLRLTWVRA